jgi:hypothetical protein
MAEHLATRRFWRLVVTLSLLAAAPAAAETPYQVGDRWFPSTPLTDNPFVADAAYATFQHLRQTGSPNFGENDLTLGFEKRLTDQLGITVAGKYEILTPLGQSNLYGWDNLYATLKYQGFESVAHETALSLGVQREFGGTGTSQVGAEGIGFTTPTLYAAKGFGDLPDDMRWLRPLAMTGTFGIKVPDARINAGNHYADMAVAGFALEYSLKYLQGNVEYVGLPPAIGRLIPIVEFTYSAPVSRAFGNTPTGLVAPGVVYSDNGLDFGVEAVLPVNHGSGTGIGVIAKAHIPFERLTTVLATPLFGD